MKRTIKTDFECSRENLDKLFACNRISAMVYNKVLELQKEYRKAHDGEWISETELFEATKGIYAINSQSVQAVVQKYVTARAATKLARDKGLKNQYPWRYKRSYPTTWKANGFKLINSKLSLSLATFNHKRQAPIEVNLPKSTIKFLADKKLQQISLIWDNHLKMAIVYEDGNKSAEKVDTNNYCGVDLGEIHSITAFSENGSAIIITGRYLRSINRYQLKETAKLSKLMSRCKKYSRRWFKLRRAKRRLLDKTNNQIRDFNHKITRAFVNWAIAHNISKVYVGDVEGVQRNTRKGKNKKYRHTRQKLSRWNFGKHLEYLRYKLEAVGIELIKISEAYSTQTCPHCGRRRKCNSRNYKCSCGYSAHRDIHGARNILSLAKYGRFEIETPTKEETYLRTA